jgi:hypothetical protein
MTLKPAEMSLPHLKTPLSAGPMLPSELPRSPVTAIKQEEADLKTPITPPTAYTDFLKALSPAVSTPLTSTSLRSPFSFTDKTGYLSPFSQPSTASLSSQCSSESQPAKTAGKDATSSPASIQTPNSAAEQIKTTIVSAPLIPPTPFVRPSPTSLRKLRIPTGPSSAPATINTATDTPRSATCCQTPLSAATRSPFSPTSWYIDGKTKVFGAPLSASPRHVSVRQVVTRTVTYRATPLEPAPRGKRRRLE